MVLSFRFQLSFLKTDMYVSRTAALSAMLALPGNCAAQFPGKASTALRAVMCDNHTSAPQNLSQKKGNGHR